MFARAKRVLRRFETRLFHDPRGRHLLRAARVGRYPRQYLRRTRVARDHGLPLPLAVDPELGYRRIEAHELPGIEALMERAHARIEAVRPVLPEWQSRQPGRHALNFDLLSDELLQRWPEFLDLSLSDEVLGGVVEHLGSVPVLRRVAICCSPGSAEPPYASQLFHFDGEDSRQLKLFVLLSEVGPDDGPLHFYSAAKSARILPGLPRVRPELPHSRVYGPYRDDHVYEVAGTQPDTLEGPPGTALLIDTSRCLHFGSRVAEGHQRFSLMVVYRRYHTVHETPFNVFDEPRFESDALRRAVLRGPQSLPIGWFYPDPSLGPMARGGGGA